MNFQLKISQARLYGLTRYLQYKMQQKYRQKHTFILYMVLLFLLGGRLQANTIQMTIAIDQQQINRPANYTFTIDRQIDPINFQFFSNPTPATLDTVIVITFPSQFLTISTASTIPCRNLVSGQSLTCIINRSLRTVSITDYYAGASTLADRILSIRMDNIINGFRAAASDNFEWTLNLSNNTVLDKGPPATNTQFSSSLTFTASTFQSCSIDASSKFVSSQSPIFLTFLSSNQIPTSGQLLITLPQYWTSDPLRTSIILNAPTCTGISNTGNLVSCTYSQSTSPTQHIITVSNLAITDSQLPVVISIANILIPPTVASSESISIYSQWPDTIQIDTCQSLITNIQPVPFQTSSIRSLNNVTVQSSFSASLDITLSRTFAYTDTIVLYLPSQFLQIRISSTNFNTFTQSINLQALTLSNFPSTPAIITANSLLSFTFSNLTNGMSTAPIDLKISIYRNNELYQQQTITYTAVSATISSFTIVPESNFVQSVGRATININPTISFPASSILIITYPSAISATTIASANLVYSTLNGSVKTGATYRVSDNQILVSNLFSSTFNGIVSIIIDSFINPTTTEPTNYRLSVQLPIGNATYGVMTGSFDISSITRALISNVISASSFRVLDTGVTYSLTIRTNHRFTAVSIILPSEISIVAGFQPTCAPNTFSFCSLSSNNLTFGGSGSLVSGEYSLSWGFNKNPNSFQPTSTFRVFTYTNGWGVQNSQGVISLTMTSTATFNLLAFPSSYINSATISLNLLLTFPENIPAARLRILVPEEVAIAGSSCTGCTIIPPFILVDIAANSSNTSLILSNIRNVGSFKPVNIFTGWLNTTNGFQSLYSTALGWTNSQQTAFLTNVYGNNNYKDQSNNFVFQLSSLSQSQQSIVISIDTSFGPLSVPPSGATLINNYTVRYPCTGASCTLNLNIINPKNFANYIFQLSSFDADNFAVGSSLSNIWNLDCVNTNCRSCNPNNTCLGCYSSSINVFNIYNTQSLDCIRTCQAGFFLLNNVTCSRCDSNCSECTTLARTCISCPTSYFLDTNYNVCVPNCSTGYFTNALNKLCTQCSEPCRSCTGSASFCLSCITNFYLLNTNCIPTCPVNFFINNDATRICDTCNSNCLTCQNKITTCLTCNNTQGLYFQNNVCVARCSTNYFLNDNICTFCQLPCRICATTHKTCSSCYINSTAPIYYNHYCIISSACPIGHYINFTNSSCEICPRNCTRCSSPTFCTQCFTLFYLYENLCLESCPNITYISSNASTGICQSCVSCRTCTSVSACTSCIASQFLYLQRCYSICPSDTFGLNSSCTRCSTNCKSCSSLTTCLSCNFPMLLYQGICYLNCPVGTFPNTTLQQCIVCPFSCSECTSLTSCQKCIATYSFENNLCVFTCSRGISFNQICYPCGLNCENCLGTTCNLCSTGFLIYNNGCVDRCPSNMLSLNNQNCVLCTERFTNCSTCTQDSCLSCVYGQLVNSSCIPCYPATFDLGGSCTPCSSICATCTSQVVCTSCVTNYYLLGSACSASCPRNMVPNGTSCSTCLDKCAVCNQVTSVCQVCNAGVYLYNNLCDSKCPQPLVVSYDFLTCVTQEVYFRQFIKSARIIPFPFTIAAVILSIIGLILKYHNKEMHLPTTLCALISLIELFTWIIFIAFEYIYLMNYHTLSLNNLICALVGLVFIILLNFLHLYFYFKYITKDNDFIKWVKRYNCSNLSFLITATTFTFKFYRFVHSKFLSREQTSMVLTSPNKLVPFSLVGIISIFLCSIPVFVGCGLALYNSIDKDQQFYIALDTIVVTGIMILLLLMDLKHPDDYFSDQPDVKNLKKKMYFQESINIGGESNNAMEENASNEQLIEVIEDEGEMALPPSANKFNSTFDSNRKNVSKERQASLMMQTNGKDIVENEKEQTIIDQQESQSQEVIKQKWTAKKYDHHGYEIRHDKNNNPVLYDQNGYMVEIDDKGQHHRYNQEGHEMKLIGDKYEPHDSQGFRIKNNKLYDSRGYQVRNSGQGNVFYDENGFEVIGSGADEKHIDEDGNTIIVDKDGKIRRYQEDGYEVVNYKGKKLLKNSQGHFVRQNSKGQWQLYDPNDGFTLRMNPTTKQYQKFNDLGFRVVKDKYGMLHYYDDKGYKVTILPGNQIIRHNEKGYRVQEDEDGTIHLFDQEGYQLVQDEHGRPYFKDQYGYRIQRDIYGNTTRYDSQGNIVVIDPTTGKHRKYNEEGLQVMVDQHGNRVLVDKRGRIVKELDDQAYEKYDLEGNKIWLNQNGYELSQDEEGQVKMYDKVGDLVEQDYEVDQFDVQKINLVTKNRSLKYKYRTPKDVDHQKELSVLVATESKNLPEEQSQISELQEFHHKDIEEVSQKDVDYELNEMFNRSRNFLFEESNQKGLEELQDFNEKEEEVDDIIEEQNDVDMFANPFDPAGSLQDKQKKAQEGLDNQMHLDELPQGNYRFGVNNNGFPGNTHLNDTELNQQTHFDLQAYIRDLDGREPDIQYIKRMQEQQQRIQAKRDLNNNLMTNDQERISIKSVADVSINERSFDNEGVQPMENRTDFDQINSLDGLEIPFHKKQRNNRSEISLINNKKQTNTVYNYNTINVQIKNKNRIYDEDEEIESLHEEDWQEQMNPMQFQRVKEDNHHSNHHTNANTNVYYIDQNEENVDTLSDFVHQSQTKKDLLASNRKNRYERQNEMLSGKVESIQEIQERLFRQAEEKGIKERRQFRLSGAANPLVEYAKKMQANKRSLEEMAYLQRLYKRR